MNFMDFSDKEGDFLYSVLNVSEHASPAEIHDRYRELSLIFHPDKQRNDQLRDVAAKNFLDIQKAYEVLSDPFLRNVYDTLGNDGLKVIWPENLRKLPSQEVKKMLQQLKWTSKHQDLRKLISPEARLNCSIDASSLFEPGFSHYRWPQRMRHRLQNVSLLTWGLKYNTRRTLSDKTNLLLMARMNSRGREAGGDVVGTIRHQFSPRLTCSATSSLFSSRTITLDTLFRDDKIGNISVRTYLPLRMTGRVPPVTFCFSRILSAKHRWKGDLSCHFGPLPQLSVFVTASSPLALTSDASDSPWEDHDTLSTPILPSVSGLKSIFSFWTYGVSLNPREPKVTGQWGIAFSELAFEIKAGLQFGLDGLSWLFSGGWTGDTASVKASLSLGFLGVGLDLDLYHLGQRLHVPILLSSDYDPDLAFWTIVVPSSALVLGYHFIVIPRRRRQRIRLISEARQKLDEDITIKQKTQNIISILTEPANKRMAAEAAKDGLVILEATYGPAESFDFGSEYVLDVTVAVQALVSNSQLHIPGHRSKAGLQGFYDLAPFVVKALRIRYTFQGRVHYAEFLDDLPVVLPLADHLVD
ncbi:DnaJ-domain-containing protein [Armillaria gallica]|uniref:DnaJ-domain-containing protein n=1 Tax=Armillaria gallica TaxID=47427 RepID=A0A2H3DHF4_ARMGA|nr:DnaJ-domain-containing protein [Armillaria gallica]